MECHVLASGEVKRPQVDMFVKRRSKPRNTLQTLVKDLNGASSIPREVTATDIFCTASTSLYGRRKALQHQGRAQLTHMFLQRMASMRGSVFGTISTHSFPGIAPHNHTLSTSTATVYARLRMLLSKIPLVVCSPPLKRSSRWTSTNLLVPVLIVLWEAATLPTCN